MADHGRIQAQRRTAFQGGDHLTGADAMPLAGIDAVPGDGITQRRLEGIRITGHEAFDLRQQAPGQGVGLLLDATIGIGAGDRPQATLDALT